MSLEGVQPLRQQASQAGAARAQAWQLHQPGRAGACTAAKAWQRWLQAQVSDETAFEGGSCLRLQGEGVGSMVPLLRCCFASACRLCSTRKQVVCIGHVGSNFTHRCMVWCLQC